MNTTQTPTLWSKSEGLRDLKGKGKLVNMGHAVLDA